MPVAEVLIFKELFRNGGKMVGPDVIDTCLRLEGVLGELGLWEWFLTCETGYLFYSENNTMIMKRLQKSARFSLTYECFADSMEILQNVAIDEGISSYSKERKEKRNRQKIQDQWHYEMDCYTDDGYSDYEREWREEENNRCSEAWFNPEWELEYDYKLVTKTRFVKNLVKRNKKKIQLFKAAERAGKVVRNAKNHKKRIHGIQLDQDMKSARKEHRRTKIGA